MALTACLIALSLATLIPRDGQAQSSERELRAGYSSTSGRANESKLEIGSEGSSGTGKASARVLPLPRYSSPDVPNTRDAPEAADAVRNDATQQDLQTPKTTRGNALSDLTPNEDQNPPRELFPPPLPEAPVLLEAGANVLKFVVRIPCKERCPVSFIWFYKKAERDWDMITEVQMSGYSSGVSSSATLRNLTMSTAYTVRAKPHKLDDSNKDMVYWYNHSKYAPFTPMSFGLTCTENQESVQDLLVHSAGPRWLALSWRPPTPECTTYLEYHVRHYAELLPGGAWKRMGAFWSNATWSLEGNVKPCSLWPDRHCLLIMNDVVPDRNHTIEMKVIRVADNKESKVIQTRGRSANFSPSSPVDVRCVEAQPTSLKFIWRCPMQPGGRLTLIRIHLEEILATGASTVTKISKYVGMRPEYQHKIERLNPSTLYKVTVWFESFGGFNGNPTSLEVWTTPDSPLVKASAVPCSVRIAENPTAVSAAASRTTELLASGGLPWWGWMVVVFLAILLPIAFLLGKWKSNNSGWNIAKFSKSSSACSSEADSSKAHTRGEDLEALCEVSTVPRKTTPPASTAESMDSGFKDYAQPLPLSPDCRPLPRISLHHYEDPHDIYDEQPYAEALDAATPPPPYYTEVRRPSPAPSPLYAEVDKKRRIAPPPPPPTAPPPLPPPLQDSR